MTNQEQVIKGKDGKIFPSLVPIGNGYIKCGLNPIYDTGKRRTTTLFKAALTERPPIGIWQRI